MLNQPGGLGHVQQPNQAATGANVQMQQQQGIIPGQPPMTGMQQHMGGKMQQTLGSIGQQHSLGGPGQSMQQLASKRQQSFVSSDQQQVGVMVKAEPIAPQNIAMIQQRAPTTSQAQPTEAQTGTVRATSQDPIVRFKQLLPQLKECLVNLISVARQNFIGNASIDNLEKTGDTSLLPRFDKTLEQFYAICNQIQANLSLANDQLSHTISSIQHTPLTTNQMKDNVNLQVYTSYIMTVKQQLAYAKDIQNLLLETINRRRPHHPPTAPGHMS